jgi:hypothetical protein
MEYDGMGWNGAEWNKCFVPLFGYFTTEWNEIFIPSFGKWTEWYVLHFFIPFLPSLNNIAMYN